MSHNYIYAYILVMALTSFVIRVLPLTLIRKEIGNRFIRSFLYYVPYVTLSVMIFPAIIEATRTPLSGLAALIVGVVAAFKGLDLFRVSLLCCLCVLVFEFFLI